MVCMCIYGRENMATAPVLNACKNLIRDIEWKDKDDFIVIGKYQQSHRANALAHT